jgi:hypothetical protein
MARHLFPRTVTTQADGEPPLHRTGARMVVTSFRGGNAGLWLLDGAAAFGPFP